MCSARLYLKSVSMCTDILDYSITTAGFTLFVAKGREFKFFGDDFKCGTCGAGKEFFKDNSLEAKN